LALDALEEGLKIAERKTIAFLLSLVGGHDVSGGTN